MVTLVVEDGSSNPLANSYISLADADAYFADRENAEWAGNAAATRSLHLFNAAISLDGLYQQRYLSQRIRESQQGLQFPRYVFWDNYYRRYDQGSIPQPLLDAQCEIANLALQGVDIFPEERTDIHVTSQSIRVGDIAQSTGFNRTAKDVSTYANFRKVELILQPILQSKTKPIKFTR